MKSRRVLITGGTGSFGKAFVCRVLELAPDIERLVVFSRDELKQFEMAQEFRELEHRGLRYFLGDVRDADRLAMATEVEIIAAVATNPNLHVTLGVDGVPASTWEEIHDLVARHRHAGDDDARAEAHARLMVVVGESIPLTTIVNSVGALSDR